MNIHHTLSCISLFYKTGNHFYLDAMDTECEILDKIVSDIIAMEQEQSKQYIVAPSVSEETLETIMVYAKKQCE